MDNIVQRPNTTLKRSNTFIITPFARSVSNDPVHHGVVNTHHEEDEGKGYYAFSTVSVESRSPSQILDSSVVLSIDSYTKKLKEKSSSKQLIVCRRFTAHETKERTMLTECRVLSERNFIKIPNPDQKIAYQCPLNIKSIGPTIIVDTQVGQNDQQLSLCGKSVRFLMDNEDTSIVNNHLKSRWDPWADDEWKKKDSKFQENGKHGQQYINSSNYNLNIVLNIRCDLALDSILTDDAIIQLLKIWKTRLYLNKSNGSLVRAVGFDTSKYLMRMQYRSHWHNSMLERLLPLVATYLSPAYHMSMKAKILATKDPFIFARLAKSVHDRTPSKSLPNQENTYKEVTKMGGNNSRFVSINRVSPINGEIHSNRNIQRNGQKETYKRPWRHEKRLSSYEAPIKAPLRTDRIRPKVPKRGTYIKHKSKLTEDKETSGESEKENKSSSTVSNSDASQPILPLRSDSLPPDGDSLRSDEHKSLASSETAQSKCSSCSEIQQRLTKANTEKGVLTVCLEKVQSELAVAQKKIKELTLQLHDDQNNDDYAILSSKDLEAEMCQLQKDKAILLHELHVTRKQLTRVLEQCETSDSSHVSSIYVVGSGKDSDDDFRSLGNEDEEDYSHKVSKQLECANAEIQRLKGVQERNEELEASVRHFEDRIIELQEQIRFAEVEKRDASAQTLRKDGTFTRQQSSDKTKIPKRLFTGSPNSLPVIPDPHTNIQRFRTGTASLSRAEILQKNLSVKEKEISILRNTLSTLEKELGERKGLGDWSQTARMKELKAENENLREQLKITRANYYKEMILRKKYFNLSEEMKGKIRVFCRIKPRDQTRKNSACLEVPDEYSVNISTQRGTYEFTFDNIFTSGHTQEEIFQDVQGLIQSALDGYNVCIFAYGQTGSGKTFTLIGTEEQPGIGPRAFRRIFELVRENQSDMDFKICVSFFELYNDSLIDLLKNVNEDKLKIRRDHYGLVYVQGSESREVKTDQQLLDLFNEACCNRHVGATRMNTESSRSHLIVTILIESTNKITGTILKGKLSLVDLAGSERTGKTAVVAGQLKEANSINKSLSSLGDVIAALSSEQQHVPYRNNKLTLLMQDSLGNNAKTLMFVTISSSGLNAEESLSSLTYASRVKQITNAATRMSESKEIARLRSIIMKLSKEEKANGRL